MKKYLILAAAAMVAGVGALSAKNVEDLRIYINPGHGGWAGGDRHMGTIGHGDADYTDTCGFYESNTNLWKGLAMLQRLYEQGFKYDPTLNQKPEGAEDVLWRYGAARDLKNQGLVMSHVKLGESRSINEIAEEVEMNNFDYFISIHSNAHTDGASTNYPALFVRGENKTQSVPGSVEGCKAVWPYAFSNTHQCWSNYSMTNPAVYYDIDFWSGDHVITTHPNGNVVKGYYAVLRHTVPGFLCEGYFHTYQPARHRAMNPDVDFIEGTAYARGFCDYFGVAKDKTGEIYGIVRDAHERLKHKYYTGPGNSADALMPLNGVKVVLKDEAGNVAGEYTTDNEWNGAFVFKYLKPGKYTVEASAEGYKAMDVQYAGPFEVKEATTVYPKVYLENVAYEPPAVVYTDYPDEVNTPLFKAAEEYNMTVAVETTVPELEGKHVKRLIARGDNLYVLAHDPIADPKSRNHGQNPVVMVLDATTLAVKSTLSTEGCEGTASPLADIALTADNVLIGSAAELCQLVNQAGEDYVREGETFGVCNIYRWTNDDNGVPTGKPSVWLTTSKTANLYRAVTGFTLAYTGTTENGTVVIPSYSAYYDYGGNMWLNMLYVADGEKVSEAHENKTRDKMHINNFLGNDVTVTIAPNDNTSFIVNSPNTEPAQFKIEGYEPVAVAGNIPVASEHEGYFKHAGHSMAVLSDVAADGKQQGVRLVDITNGLLSMKDIATSNTAMEATDAVAATAGRTVVTRNTDDEITDANIDLYTVRGNKFTRFTTSGTEQPKASANWAYGLKGAADAGKYTFTFSLTDAANAHIELVPTADNAAGQKLNICNGSYEKGENTAEYDLSELSGNYTWSVVVDNPAVPRVTTQFDSGVSSSGVAIDLNAESPNYGRIYVSQKAGDGGRGLRVFNPDFSAVGGLHAAGVWDTGVGASPWRLAVLPTGKVIMTDWGDKHGGMYLWNEEQDKADNFFAGTIKSSSGEWILDGKTLGGSTSGVAVVGSGADTKLVSFQEDWPTDYQLNLVTYDLGEKELIDFQPTQSEQFKTLSGYLINGNVDVLVREQGMVLNQVRGSGNNAKGVPAFMVTDREGNILMNSGADLEELDGSVGATGITADGKTLVHQDASGKLHVYGLTWGDNFGIAEQYKFDALNGKGSDLNSYQITFDPAGNLFLANRSSMRVYALPREAAQAVTPAKAEYVVNGTALGVDDIIDAAEDSNAPVRFYNLNGVEVGADNMAPGLYIRRQGNTATKVVVK